MAEDKKPVDNQLAQETDRVDDSNVIAKEAFEKFKTDMEKRFEDLQKTTAGKDRKITDQANVIKQLQEQNLSKEDVIKLHEKELQDKENEMNTAFAAKELQLKEYELSLQIEETLSKIPNFPLIAKEFVTGPTPKNKEEAEAKARRLIKILTDQGNLRANAQKITKPQSLSGAKQIGRNNVMPSADILAEMSERERQDFFAQAYRGKGSHSEVDAIAREVEDILSKKSSR